LAAHGLGEIAVDAPEVAQEGLEAVDVDAGSNHGSVLEVVAT
jgi:hypothetical protein